MKKLLFLFMCIFITNSNYKINAQYLFSPDSVLQYLAATSEPPADWYEPEFVPTGWTTDTAVIGFGDILIRPVNSNAKSIYARCKFNISKKSDIKALNLTVDYDDGYIAYINGYEIARVNIDKSVKFPAYDALSILSHESEFITENTYPVLGVYLDTSILNKCLVNGENILAIHVLNDSVNGSDMTLIPVLFNISNTYYNIYNYENRYKRIIDIDSSNLPLVIINTDEYGMPASENKRTNAFMGIVDNGYGNYNKPTDMFNVYKGNISVELRGQSSRAFPKQNYRFELLGKDGNDSSVSLLGMPKDEDWILYGPFADKSQVRNALMFSLGRQLGHYQPRSMFCELIYSGQAVGLYALTENIKRGANRINIAKLKNTDIDGYDVTGGYIFKYDKENPYARTIVYPKDDSIRPEQTAYFNAFMKSYDSIFSTNKFIEPGFRKYLDDTSLVDFVIMNELCKNADAYLYSTYCYKDRDDRDGRVKFGPLWDFDLAFGNSSWQNGHVLQGWQWNEPTNQRLGLRRLFQDTVLVNFMQERYYSFRESVLSDGHIFEVIDSLVNYVKSSRERNYEIWPVVDKNPWSNNQTYLVTTYDAEITYLKNWISSRTAWMDENMDDVYYPLKVYSSVETYVKPEFTDCYVYPNPFDEMLTLELNPNNAINVKVEICNVLGQMFYSENLGTIAGHQKIELQSDLLGQMQTGIYFLKVYANNTLSQTLKIIKK